MYWIEWFNFGFGAGMGFACGMAVVDTFRAYRDHLAEMDELDSYSEDGEQSFEAELPYCHITRRENTTAESDDSQTGKKQAKLLNIGLNIRLNLSGIRM